MNAVRPNAEATAAEHAPALRFRLGGRVQGVGFRPFVYRLAHRYGLSGWVRNDGGEVEIHAEGAADRLRAFGTALLERAPPAAAATLLSRRRTPSEAAGGFRILPSTGDGAEVHVPPDLFTCDECLAELHDPADRRHRYPFVNCTQCGPRYTLIRQLPYDRANTTLDGFPLCAACEAEYEDPLDRRFHAQPLACPDCGPTLSWHEGDYRTHGNAPALGAALAALAAGRIVAVRGVGGYHLFCDAANEAAVSRLRDRKGRPGKPLAVMVPWRGADGLGFAQRVAALPALEAEALRSAVRPIVVVAAAPPGVLAPSIAPGLHECALMLPYSPLHHLLLEGFGSALVATSGNVSGEPVLTDPAEAEARLVGVADGFLQHDRPIARPADDPVWRVVAGRARPVRLGRGTAPLELELARPVAVPTLAVGGYSKLTVAIAWGRRAVVSPHIGELSSPRGRAVFAATVSDLQRLYGVRVERVVHDAHPGFPGTRWARESGHRTHPVWHHEAHAAAVAGEFPAAAPLLCFTWDGIGLGRDGTLWGGEALLGAPGAWTRVASMRPFQLPGGDRAAREPWRAALALCWSAGVAFPDGERRGGGLLRAAAAAGVNAPWTTSVGRLFDAAAALVGICGQASYEAEAAMKLEAACDESSECVTLPLSQDARGVLCTDWGPLLPRLVDPARTPGFRARLFHETLTAALLAQALAVRAEHAVTRVGLAGGVFQNRLLCERAQALLGAAGFETVIPARLPVNDAALSFGQLVEASALPS